MNKTADAVIVGGGVIGCSILYNLGLSGMKDTVMVEQNVLGSGSTGRSQAICRMHYSNPVTAQLAWKSLKIFKDFEGLVGGTSGFVKTGYMVVVASDDRQALRDNISMQRQLGINTDVVSHEDLKDIAPMIDVDGSEGIAYEPESGYADPYSVTTGYASSAREMGAQIYMQITANRIEITSGRVTGVVTDHGRVSTPNAVIATGPWSKAFFASIGLDIPLKTVRHQVISIRRPEDLVPSHPTVGDIAQRFSFRPDSTNLTLLGAGEEEADTDSYNQGVNMQAVEDSFVKLVRRMPAMSQGFFRGGWSGLFTVTPDWHPILDKVEGVQGLYCAVGFSGHGFKLSPMVGVTMTELILQGEAKSIDITPLRFNRFKEGKPVLSRYGYSVLA